MPSISIYGDGIAYGNYPLDDHVSWARMSPTPCAAIQAAASGKFTTTDLTKPGIRYESYVTGVAPDGTEAIPGKGVGTKHCQCVERRGGLLDFNNLESRGFA